MLTLDAALPSSLVRSPLKLLPPVKCLLVALDTGGFNRFTAPQWIAKCCVGYLCGPTVFKVLPLAFIGHGNSYPDGLWARLSYSGNPEGTRYALL
jgi:hypothetical protein